MSGAVDCSRVIQAIAYQALINESEPSIAPFETNISLADFEADHCIVVGKAKTTTPYLYNRLLSVPATLEPELGLTYTKHLISSMSFVGYQAVHLHATTVWKDLLSINPLEGLGEFRRKIFTHYGEKLNSPEEIFESRLDKHSSERLKMLMTCEHGWDGDDAEPLSTKSLERCLEFISEYDLKNKGVGVFMDMDGNIVLNWPLPNERNKLIEITFGESSYSLYMSDWDDRIEHDELNETLKGYLRQAI